MEESITMMLGMLEGMRPDAHAVGAVMAELHGHEQNGYMHGWHCHRIGGALENVRQMLVHTLSCLKPPVKE
jgi:hypothetical protein